jgi:hypothetical protein
VNLGESESSPAEPHWLCKDPGFGKESRTAKTPKTSKKEHPEDFISAVFGVFVVHVLTRPPKHQNFVGSHRQVPLAIDPRG